VLERIRQLQPSEPLHHRDLGVCLLRAGQPGRAIDQLSAYLGARSSGSDVENVRQFLRQARGEVARWN
jgi:regulator of sirC expression with transglutaminase-like and TPR domain